ncbi:MAG: flippase-like domain-containing protein, partial [Allobaculum sp.]|nr:flippase-like domain-containing protein [Allobaculum sp.]
MAANNKKYFWNIVIIVAVTAIAMYFALKDNFKDIVDTIAKMNIFSLLFILAWGMIINVVIGVGYKLLGSVYKKGYSLKEGVIVAFVGTFFAGITPSSTGGQFGQAYVLKRQGISYSDGASLLWADFVIYQTTLMIYVTI